MERAETIILGAGLAGMATALHLGKDREWVILEAADHPGGLVVTREERGYRFDVTGHWLHMRDPEVRGRFGGLVPMAEVERRSRIFTRGCRVAYPYQSNLKDLPAAVRADCLAGAMEAHRRRASGEPVSGSFRDFVLFHFGEGIAREFMFPYNTKLWGVGPERISHAWCQRFVPVPDLRQILEGASSDANERAGYNATFSYPVAGGIGAFSEALAREVGSGGRLRLGCRVVRVHPRERWVETADGTRWGYRHLVSSVPLDAFLEMAEGVPEEVREAGERLVCTPLTWYDLGLNRKVLGGLHWVYLPDPEVPAYRVGCYSNAVESMAPDGCSSLYVELANGREIDHEEALDAVLGVISELGEPVDRGNVDVWRVRRIEHSYVIYDTNYEAARGEAMCFLGSVGILPVGRYGRWVYSSMEDALLDGRDAAGAILTGSGQRRRAG